MQASTELGEPRISVDSAHAWVIQQACREARDEAKTLKIGFSEGASIELTIIPTSLAGAFALVIVVQVGIIVKLWRLLRLERARNGAATANPISNPNEGLESPSPAAPPPGSPRPDEIRVEDEQAPARAGPIEDEQAPARIIKRAAPNPPNIPPKRRLARAVRRAAPRPPPPSPTNRALEAAERRLAMAQAMANQPPAYSDYGAGSPGPVMSGLS